MKVLVTGGAGFIGSHLVDGFLNEGFDVAVVDNLSRGTMANLHRGTHFYRVDLRDHDSMDLIISEEKPEIVCHHAAQIDVRKSVQDPVADAECNILGTLNLLNLSVKYGVRRFIFASTGGAIYGEPSSLPACETAPAEPLSPYGASKRAVEIYLQTFHSIFGLKYVVLRYGNVFGPRQRSVGEAGVVAIFCEQMLAGITPTIYGDGSKTRDYVEVSDVVRANLAALERGEDEIINIASGKPTTDYQIFTAVREALGLPAFEPHFAPKRPGEVEHIFLNVDKAETVLGWKPRVGLAVGVSRTAEWFRRHFPSSIKPAPKVNAPTPALHPRSAKHLGHGHRARN